MRVSYAPPWRLTRWGFLPEYLWRVNDGCDEDHNESKFIIVPLLGEIIVWTGRKVECDGECA